MQEKFLAVQNAGKSGIPGEKRRRRCRMQVQRCILQRRDYGGRKNAAAVKNGSGVGV